MEFAPIGNGRISALISKAGAIVWWCFPQLDADPVFSRLLSGDEPKGFCDVQMKFARRTLSRYVRNTAILQTEIEDNAGNAIRITDFAPRFWQFERLFHPPQIWRRIEPIAGIPQVTLRVRPTFNYGVPAARRATGSNHVTYTGGRDDLRLTTDAPLSYIVEETPFALTQPITLMFGPDEPLEAAVDTIGRTFLDATINHWQTWVRGLGIPFEWQSEIIRAAITLKLCSFEETGAIIAAPTTSLPEAPHSGRNWDYRYCWLRDAYFVIKALNRLGATQTMESYVNYITSIAIDATGPLKPVYGIVHNASLAERTVETLAGFENMGPVRIGNQAAEQPQHDAYGSIILGVSNMFIDERLPRMGNSTLFHSLERFGQQAIALFLEPDAGLWEYRGRTCVHTYSATMCWVACDRLARIARRLGLTQSAVQWHEQAEKMRVKIIADAWNPRIGALAGSLNGNELDASVLLLPELGLLPASDERFIATCKTIGHELSRNGFVMRYTQADDFGLPETAFLVCQFWYIDALKSIDCKEQARDLFIDLLSKRNSYGLLSEDINPTTGALWGNHPQTYSMAGIINSGISLSRTWEQGWDE